MNKRENLDLPWKLILHHFFKELMAFLLPDFSDDIDWEKGYECLDKELLKIQKHNEIGNKLADSLIKIFKKEGEEVWVLTHVEIQGRREKGFSQRMWEYYYRIYDKYKKPLLSLAIFTDPNKQWRPDYYERHLGDCKLTFKYPVIKLIDFLGKQEWLNTSTNPIAKVIEAHLEALVSKGKPDLRLSQKVKLVKKLYHLGYSGEEIKILFAFIDYSLSLPTILEKAFRDEIHEYEKEVNMQYITSIERMGRQEGRQEGMQAGELKVVKMLIEKKFGPLTSSMLSKLEEASLEKLEMIIPTLLEVEKPEDLDL